MDNPQSLSDARQLAQRLMRDIKAADHQFRMYADTGKLGLASMYLTEYQKTVRRAATAVLAGNAYLANAARKHKDLGQAVETMKRSRDVVASEPLLHLDFNAPGKRRAAAVLAASMESKPRARRQILDSKLDILTVFHDLYDGVVMTAQNVPIGALHRHAQGRLKQSFAVLVLVEQAVDAGILPRGSELFPTGARVQDKTTSREYPAAHRLPCDLSVRTEGGELHRLSDHFDMPIDRLWVDKHVFAPTDKVHRLANVADRWCEEAGMISSLAKAATAVAAGEITAEVAMEQIVEPGYQRAIQTSLSKVERNFSWMERQALRCKVVDIHGQAYDRLPDPLVLHVKGLEERAVAKEMMEQTLRVYFEETHLTPAQRMQTAITVSTIVENEQRMVWDTWRPGPRRTLEERLTTPYMEM